MKAQLESALKYAARKWTVIPMKMAEKRPAVRWKRYQTRPPSKPTLRRWFARTDHGVAIVFGEASGGLACRDFDELGAYNEWAARSPALAASLPTVETRRGRHVYFVAAPGSVAEFRRRMGKPIDGRGAIALGDGELRAGSGSYAVAPPSIHPSGHVYRWLLPLPEGPLPVVDALEFWKPDLEIQFRQPCHTEDAREMGGGDYGCVWRQENPQKTSEVSTRVTTVEEAIAATLPTGPGQRHRQVFELARALKSIPHLAEADPGSLRAIVEEWHRRALPFINTKPFEETWIDFLNGWPAVHTPQGDGSLTKATSLARAAGPPDLLHVYDQQEIALLVGICRELQRAAGDQPFFLSCRSAGRQLGVQYKQANRWLRLLAVDGVIELTQAGRLKGRQAAEYRYLLPLLVSSDACDMARSSATR